MQIRVRRNRMTEIIISFIAGIIIGALGLAIFSLVMADRGEDEE